MTEHADGLTVAEMSTETGVTPHTLRYYERVGLIDRVARSSGNQRRYSAADVEWLRFLLRLRETGMPIARMREYAALRAQGVRTLRAREALLESHRRAVRERIARLRDHERALDVKLDLYRQQIQEENDD